MTSHEDAPLDGDNPEFDPLSGVPIIDNRYSGAPGRVPFGALRMFSLATDPAGDLHDQLACYGGNPASVTVDDAGDTFGQSYHWAGEI